MGTGNSAKTFATTINILFRNKGRPHCGLKVNLKFSTDNADTKKFGETSVQVIKMKLRLLFITIFLFLFFFLSSVSGFKLKHCADVLPSPRPVLCSNEKDYRKNEQPPDRPLHIQVQKVELSLSYS